MEKIESNLPIRQKVSEWLSQEGYPLEFFTASTFRKNGFGVWQGTYTEDNKTSTMREIDVFAYFDRKVEGGFLRIAHIVECKWTKDKPWVVFCSNRSMSPEACITQTIASKLADGILWLIAGEKTLHSTSVFSTPSLPGFGGRQAFSKDNDAFYTAIQSITNKAKSEADDFGVSPLTHKKFPRHGCVYLPLIVIDGELFEATYDETKKQISLNQVQSIRLHWKGSESWRYHATVDIVVKDKLNDFVALRKSEMKNILDVMEDGYKNIAECFSKQNLNTLKVTKGSRGIIGIPSLLLPLVTKKKSKKRTKK